MEQNRLGIRIALGALALAVAGVIAGSLLLRGRDPIWHVLFAQLAVIVPVLLALSWWRPGWPPGRHLLIGLGLALPAFLLSVSIGALQTARFGLPPEQPVEQVVQAMRARGGWPLVGLLACLLPGLCEESLFRGVFLGGLRRRLPPWIAIALAAIAFAALHLSPWRFAPQLGLGLLLGWASLRWSWWTAAVAHAGHNAAVLTLVLLTAK